MSSDQHLLKEHVLAFYLKGVAQELFIRKYKAPEVYIPDTELSANEVVTLLHQYFTKNINEKQLVETLCKNNQFKNFEIIRLITQINRFKKSVDNQQ